MKSNSRIRLGGLIYSENFLFKKMIGFLEVPLVALSVLFLNAYSYVSKNQIEKNLFLYSSYILPIIWFSFFIWGLFDRVEIYENGIHSNYSLKYRGTWYFDEIEDILIKPFPYGRNMKQVVILLKNGEEKTVIAYDRERVINRFYEEAKKAFENYKSRKKGEGHEKSSYNVS